MSTIRQLHMQSNILHAFSEKSFLYLWIGEIFTQLASNLLNFLLILVIYNQTHSNTAVSGIVISFTMPAIFFGSIAGVYVDHWNKKKVLITVNILRAILLVVLAFSLHNLAMVYFLSFTIAVLTQFFIPAESPLIPLVVHNKNLLSANALFGMGIFGSILLAYVLSGPLLIMLRPVSTLIALAVMMIIGAVFISLITPTYAKARLVKEEDDTKLNISKDLRHTFSLITRTKEIYRSIFLLALSQTLILVVATIAPGYANQVIGINVEDFPLLFVAPAAFGVIIGAISLVQIFHSHPKEKVITFGILVSGIAMLLLPFGSRVASRGFIIALNEYLPHLLTINILHIIVLVAFVLGFANSLVFVPANTILQEKTEDEVRGKIYGFLNSIVGAFSLIPILLAGGLSDIFGVSSVLVGIGIFLLLLAAIRAYFNRL